MQPLPECGVVHALPNDEYHRLPAVSNTGLLLIGRSPRHYWGRYLDPLRPPPAPPKPGQFVGTMAHCATLEPVEFARRYVVGPDVSRNTKEWRAFEAPLRPGQTAVKPDEAEQARSIARSLRALADVRELLARGRPEVSAFWIEDVSDDDGEIHRVACRVRPDWVHEVDEKRVILLDVKTTGNAAPNEFARQIVRQSYHHQAAFYIDGYEKATGKEVAEFVFAQAEVDHPYVAASCALYPEDIEVGRAMYRANLRTYVNCRTADRWPGYGESVQLVALPARPR